jgi:hypothetical protein
LQVTSTCFVPADADVVSTTVVAADMFTSETGAEYQQISQLIDTLQCLEGFISADGGLWLFATACRSGLISYPSDIITVNGPTNLGGLYLQRDVLLTRPVKST